ncbi:hypothetical protein BD289DRAFT_445859 [Coniella lustricola]|uniref:Uncharacterized protein n=1 Tax=Coniella lustricola TaxID=2025994 RepID=A0A2T2ZUH7_9PEZI|nr:hypothetical protein BD289DRAFT_445859 [Coniella lustricola]
MCKPSYKLVHTHARVHCQGHDKTQQTSHTHTPWVQQSGPFFNPINSSTSIQSRHHTAALASGSRCSQTLLFLILWGDSWTLL